MKKKLIILAAAATFAASALTGCGGTVTYNDGTYTGQSEVYENTDGSTDGNGYGVATITIENGEIVACTFESYEPDGTLKDEEYGKQDGEVANRDYYNKAQKAVAACEKYAESLVSTGDVNEVDAISGATINYDSFLDAVSKALDKAKAD